MGFFGSFFNAAADKVAIADSEKVVKFVRSLGPMELGDLRACVGLALAFLVADSQTKGEKTLEKAMMAMDNQRQITPQDSGEISILLLDVMKSQKQAHASPSAINQRIASGLPIWICSLRALTHPAVLPHARELWSMVQSGDSITTYDLVDALSNQLQGHPMGQYVKNIGMVSAPSVFVAR